MVAYNFMERFKRPIRRRTKRHTIRAKSKRRHARPGEMLQLYTGMRTKKCRKICRDQQCLRVGDIMIAVHQKEFAWIMIDGNLLSKRKWKDFAFSDGFTELSEFHRTFLKMHGVGIFEGVIIYWL